MTGQTYGQTGTATAIVDKESKKRAFGTELTNICFKRSKLVSPIDVAAEKDVKPLHLVGECHPIKCNTDRCTSGQGPDQVSLSAPVNTTRSCDGESNKVKKTHDWESLASSYRPQYQNQGIFQALLGLISVFCLHTTPH